MSDPGDTALSRYQVGQPYSLTRRRWPEATDYNYRGGAHELRLFLARPSGAEVRAVRQGEAEFALYVAPPLIVLLYRFELDARRGIPWSDQPFSIHRVPADERQIPEAVGATEPHALLHVILVSADDGIVRALRSVSLSPAFTAALHLAIREQAALPWDAAAYDRALADLYRRYPSTRALLAVAQSRSFGGR